MTWLEILTLDSLFALPMVVLYVVLYFFGYRREKNAAMRLGVNAVEFDAPDGFVPAYATYFFPRGLTLDTNAATGATVIDLCVRKYLTVSPRGNIYVISKSANPPKNDLRSFGVEQPVLRMFTDGYELELSEDGVRSFIEKCDIRDELWQSYYVYMKPYYVYMNPAHMRVLRIFFTAIFVSLFLSWLFYLGGLIMSAISVIVALPYSSVMIYGLVQTHRSTELESTYLLMKGKLREYIRYLKKVEVPRSAKATPMDWNAHTPYLVALGLDDYLTPLFSRSVTIKNKNRFGWTIR